MFKLILENAAGEQVQLTNRKEYAVTEIQGLNPPGATINTSEMALYDGAKYISSKVGMRSINIAVAINYSAEHNRIALYKVVRTKQPIIVRYQNGTRDIFIQGYVESFEIDYFANKQTATISILCPEPFFKAAEEMISDINLILGAFHFPFAIEETAPIPFSYYGEITEINIENVGDIACGFRIEINITGTVTNPRIYNRVTTEFFGLDYVFQAGDAVYINTERGSKEVQLLRSGEYINIFNYITKGSTWLQLEAGDNVLTYDTADDSTNSMQVRFIHHPLYEGV